MLRLGFVGLGTMGTPIAQRLIRAGFAVVGTARNREHVSGLVATGLTWADSPREVAHRSDIVLCMLRDPEAFGIVLSGEEGLLAGLRPGSLLVDLSTNDPATLALHEDSLAKRRCHLVAAPVQGTPSMAADGMLSIMLGGAATHIAKLQPVFDAISNRITHVGSAEQAAVAKLAVNLNVAVQMVGFCEGLVLAEKAGVSPALFVELFTKSALASPMLVQRGPFVIEPPTEPWADIALARKDLVLALSMGRHLEVALPLTALTHELALSAAALGHASDDLAALLAPVAALSRTGSYPAPSTQTRQPPTVE